MTERQENDVLGWGEQVRLALEDPALAGFEQNTTPDEAACQAAYRLAVALGYCRLFAVQLPDDLDGTLPAPEAMAAAEQLRRLVARAIDDLPSVVSRLDEAAPLEEDDLVASVLEMRMDAWAAYLAVQEAEEDCTAGAEPLAKPLGEVIDRLEDELDRFDSLLCQPEYLAILATIVRTPLLDNWRRLLEAGPYGDPMPWWLDGTLEQEYHRIVAFCKATMPGPEAWRRRRERLRSAPAPRRSAGHPASALPRLEFVPAMAAASAGDDILVWVLKWVSPAEPLFVLLSWPEKIPHGCGIPLSFHHAEDDQPAVKLQGQPVWLAGIPATVDEHGCAEIDAVRLQEALEQGQELVLEVGAERLVWTPTPSE